MIDVADVDMGKMPLQLRYSPTVFVLYEELSQVLLRAKRGGRVQMRGAVPPADISLDKPESRPSI